LEYFLFSFLLCVSAVCVCVIFSCKRNLGLGLALWRCLMPVLGKFSRTIVLRFGLVILVFFVFREALHFISKIAVGSLLAAYRPHWLDERLATYFSSSIFHVNPLFFSNLFPLITLLAPCGNEGPHSERHRPLFYSTIFFLFSSSFFVLYSAVWIRPYTRVIIAALLLLFIFFPSFSCLSLPPTEWKRRTLFLCSGWPAFVLVMNPTVYKTVGSDAIFQISI
jgi:hypothetical protein